MEKTKRYLFVRTIVVAFLCMVMIALPISSIAAGFSGSKAYASLSEDDYVTYWYDDPEYGVMLFHTDDDPYKTGESRYLILGETAYIIRDYPDRPGYNFIGWARINDENLYWSDDPFEIDSSNKFIAQWAPYSDVFYDPNGGTFMGSEDYYRDPHGPYGWRDNLAVLSEEPVRAGYTFSGWLYGVGTYLGGDYFVMTLNPITFQAKWDEDPLQWSTITFVNFDGDKGTLAGKGGKNTGIEFKGIIGSSVPADMEPAAYPFQGYEFEGWCDINSFGLVSVPNVFPNGDLTLCAVWAEKGCMHNWIQDFVDATCHDEGYYRMVCTVCGQIGDETGIPASGHYWGGWGVTTPATCEAGGVETRICTIDSSHTETRPITAIGHSMGAWRVITPPTCLEAGTDKRDCTRTGCSYSETRSTSLLGHDWGSWVVTAPATQIAEGLETCVCKRDSTHLMTRPMPRLNIISYNVTVYGSYSETSGSGNYNEGNIITINAGSHSGYVFNGWTVNIGGAALINANQASTTFTMPAGNVVVTANWRSAGTAPPPVVTTVNPTQPPRIVEPVVEPPKPFVPAVAEPAETLQVQPSEEPAPVPAPAPSAVEIDPLPIAEESPNAALINELADAGVPILNIGGQEVPLIAFPGMSAWALLNLILALTGIVIAVVSLFRVRFQRMHGIEGIDSVYEEEEEKEARRRHIWVLPLVIFAIFGIIFFIFTENTNNMIVLLWDQWTIVNVIAFAGVIVMARLAFKRKDEEEPDHDFNPLVSTATE